VNKTHSQRQLGSAAAAFERRFDEGVLVRLIPSRWCSTPSMIPSPPERVRLDVRWLTIVKIAYVPRAHRAKAHETVAGVTEAVFAYVAANLLTSSSPRCSSSCHSRC
jgi:hypothetical protein